MCASGFGGSMQRTLSRSHRGARQPLPKNPRNQFGSPPQASNACAHFRESLCVQKVSDSAYSVAIAATWLYGSPIPIYTDAHLWIQQHGDQASRNGRSDAA
jgi:hypothetical protein